MKFWDKIVKGVNPDEEDHFNDVFEDDEIYSDNNGGTGGAGDLSDFMSSGYSPYGTPVSNQNQNQTQNQNQNHTGYQPHQAPQQQAYQQQPVSAAVSAGIAVGGANMQVSVELKVVKPEDYQDVAQIADFLINKKTVILNLEETGKETARRLIDFLNGVAYAIQGQRAKVSEKTFVITPNNIPISSDQLKEDIRKTAGKAENLDIY
jgi:cell division inhibitor SepF